LPTLSLFSRHGWAGTVTSPLRQTILQILVQGQSTKEAAARLEISYHSADGYIRDIYDKLQVHSRSAAVAKAIKEGLTN